MNILKSFRYFLSAFLVIASTIACAKSNESTGPDGNGTGTMDPNSSYELTEAFPHLSFTRPVDLQYPPDGSNRLFVVEQRGVITFFENTAETAEKTPFLDIEERVDDRGNEEGLLGLAFHPDFEQNGYFYLNYTTNNSTTRISRFTLSDDNPQQADPASEKVILSFEQPYGNHNGGQVSFGPDGYLYIAVGDGGAGGDPQEHGQNRSTLLGTILRIDVDRREGNRNYAIPPDNPFYDNSQGYREEIYAYGLRNPWRFSFDAETGQLWTGDVGQNAYEEIDIIENGGNYGWNTMEGNHCFNPREGCDQSGLELPVLEYSQSNGDRSVTGGFVYRGPSLTELTGQYIYADYESGRIWALDFSDMDNPVNTLLYRADFGISSFGVDQDNELYICGFDGKIHKLVPAS
ncbi:PQQ-dependent sugar dehydrogenase [Halalkalibaculum sp. DA384]|uniref:PQQ-dependent sugar dehydrogenase n=1 Tax=Halalkalibaculum sp. DA384 TaxID=3373606 RepID=UPI003754F726